MATLKIRFSKKRDGGVSITYTRADGTATGQRGRDDFFVYHDIGHYAAETTLGLRRAFLGTVASGWDMRDFGSPWPRGPFPAEAASDLMTAEGLAGALDFARHVPAMSDLADIREAMQATETSDVWRGLLHITPEQWDRVRATADSLIARWKALPPGDDLELEWG